MGLSLHSKITHTTAVVYSFSQILMYYAYVAVWSVYIEGECETGKVRLVGGVDNSSSGLLEVCANGGWGTVCDYRNEWNYENAVVVCRQLNLPISSQFTKQTVVNEFAIKLNVYI